MRIAVAGATGNIGARTVSALQRDGHDAGAQSRLEQRGPPNPVGLS